MSEYSNIFQKQRLTPGQFRAVAERRFKDARCLLESGKNERANGAIYMGGFVIECLLKAILLERHPNLQRPVDPATLSRPDREVLGLLYSHALEEMLVFLPDLQLRIERQEKSSCLPLWHRFQTACEEWSVYARYSTRSATLAEAGGFLTTVQEVKQWLRRL